jgi:hypothetical protein
VLVGFSYRGDSCELVALGYHRYPRCVIMLRCGQGFLATAAQSLFLRDLKGYRRSQHLNNNDKNKQYKQ